MAVAMEANMEAALVVVVVADMAVAASAVALDLSTDK